MMKRNTWARSLYLCCLTFFSLCLACTAGAQGFGSLNGKVTDSTGAVVSNATVTLTEVKTGAATTAQTSASGLYTFPSLPPADYSIAVTAPGFQKYLQTGVTLQADQAATVNAQLKIGSDTETVTVSTDTAAIDVTSGTISQVINEQSVNDLPLNARNAAALTTLVPGVVTAPNERADQGQTKTFPVAVTIAANGSRADETNFMLDGGNNVDEYTNVNAPFPFPDALQEFSVQTSNYNAEYGQNAGGVVNIITKSGGAAYHGNLFEYLRNPYFNAKGYFGSAPNALKRHQFGGTIGGPVKIPHLVDGRHTFFFFGYQGSILHNSNSATNAYVPTAANLNGDFSNYSGQILNPRTGAPYPKNYIDPSTFDPAALAVMSHLPKVTGNGLVYYQQPIRQSFNEYIARGDQEIGTLDRLTFRYYYNDFDNAAAFNPNNLLIYADGANIRYQNALISETHSFTSNLLNVLTLSYQREISTRGPAASSYNMNDLGVQNIFQPASKAIQSISVTGFFRIGDNPHAIFQRNNYTFADDLHWVHGRHNIAFGAHVENSKVDINSDNTEPGTFTFNANNSNYAPASFLLGYLYQFGQGMGQYLNDRNQFLGFYAQDSWKVVSRLTLNYGVRYEPFFPWHEIKNRITRFSPAAYQAGTKSVVYPNAPAGLLFVGDRGVQERGTSNSYTQIMPRLGFALDVFGDGKTSLRGGGGVFFDTRQPAIFNSGPTNSSPFSLTESLTYPTGPFSNPYKGISNPYPASIYPDKNAIFPSPVQVYTYDPSGTFKVPVIYNWNVAVEQQLTSTLTTRLAYVGSHSSHLLVGLELNPSVYIPNSKLSTDQRRLFPGYSNIAEADMGGDESYHSLQATLQERIGRKLTVMANYTFSKALDNLPYGAALTGPPIGESYVYPYTFSNYKALDHGPSDFDRRHVFTASYAWQLPTVHNGLGVVRALVNGWETAGIVQAETGNPLTVLSGKDQSLTGLLQDRALVVPNVSQHSSAPCTGTAKCVTLLNPAAFQQPAIGTFGNFQKDSLYGPNYVDWDASLIRNFHLFREANLQFRAEYFDVLNHTNLGAPQTSLSGAGFGTVTSASDPRIAQFAAKLNF